MVASSAGPGPPPAPAAAASAGSGSVCHTSYPAGVRFKSAEMLGKQCDRGLVELLRKNSLIADRFDRLVVICIIYWADVQRSISIL